MEHEYLVVEHDFLVHCRNQNASRIVPLLLFVYLRVLCGARFSVARFVPSLACSVR